MEIRVLTEADGEIFRNIRLRSLQDNPEAFGRTYEESVGQTAEEMAARLKPTSGNTVFGAFEGETLVGMVGLLREDRIKERHKATIWGMYTAPEVRGKGVGKALMLKAIGFARGMEGVEQIQLTVVNSNPVARNLYLSLGFEVYGTERHALKYNGQYYDEDLMVFWIKK